MKEDILKKLEKNIGQLTKSQKKAADHIIKNPMKAAFSTIDQMANAIGTSTTTIMRLTVNLGYSGYMEFQKDLQKLLEKRLQLSDNSDSEMKNLHIESNVILKIAKREMKNLRKTFNNLSEETVFKAEGVICNASHTYIAGSSSCSVAYYLNLNLNRLFGNCDLLSADGGDFPEKVNRINKDSAVIVISMPKYEKQIISIARIAKEREAHVIAITDGLLSPLGEFADIIFSTECNSSDFYNTLTPAMAIADVLIGVAAEKHPELAGSKLNEMEDIFKILDIHSNK